MALSPEDIYEKQFSEARRAKDGYDMDEVDDFLDAVAEEMRRLIKERDSLRTESEDLKRQIANFGESSSGSYPVVAAPPSAVSLNAAAAFGTDNTDSATSVLTMAQKLHDEHVSSGLLQRDKIIAEAQIEANSLLNDAEERSRKVIGDLEQQKTLLERRVDQLRTFERDYRARLKAYIEGQLRDLDSRDSVAVAEPIPSGEAVQLPNIHNIPRAVEGAMH